MKLQRRLYFDGATDQFPARRGHDLGVSQCGNDRHQVERRNHLRCVDLNLLGRHISASAFTIQIALAWFLRLLVVAGMVVLAALDRLGCRHVSTLHVARRMVPAASKHCMDEKAGRHRARQNSVHKLPTLLLNFFGHPVKPTWGIGQENTQMESVYANLRQEMNAAWSGLSPARPRGCRSL